MDKQLGSCDAKTSVRAIGKPWHYISGGPWELKIIHSSTEAVLSGSFLLFCYICCSPICALHELVWLWSSGLKLQWQYLVAQQMKHQLPLLSACVADGIAKQMTKIEAFLVYLSWPPRICFQLIILTFPGHTFNFLVIIFTFHTHYIFGPLLITFP